MAHCDCNPNKRDTGNDNVPVLGSCASSRQRARMCRCATHKFCPYKVAVGRLGCKPDRHSMTQTSHRAPKVPKVAGGHELGAIEEAGEDVWRQDFTVLHEQLLEDSVRYRVIAVTLWIALQAGTSQSAVWIPSQERRAAILDILLRSGLSDESLQSVFQNYVRGYVHTQDKGPTHVTLSGQASWTDNLHKCHFGWAPFKKDDIDYITRCLRREMQGTSFSIIEMGAGSGWLSFLLRDRGVTVRWVQLQSEAYAPSATLLTCSWDAKWPLPIGHMTAVTGRHTARVGAGGRGTKELRRGRSNR
eukprot:scaffold605_cov400-Prasinococcus_capsulatus_cf.AAC.6